MTKVFHSKVRLKYWSDCCKRKHQEYFFNSKHEQNYRHSSKSLIDKNSYLVCKADVEVIAANMTSIRVSFANEANEPLVHISPNHNGLKKRGGRNISKNCRKFKEDKKF